MLELRWSSKCYLMSFILFGLPKLNRRKKINSHKKIYHTEVFID